MEDSVIVVRRGGVTTIKLNRPAVMNSIDTNRHHALGHAFDDFARDRSQRVCVLKAAGGRAFCAGSDLKHIREMTVADCRHELVYPASGYGGLIERLDLDKPVIAAVDGIAVGGGFELALACDLIVATEGSRFGLTEPRVGALAIAGGVHRLARQIGLKQAMGLLLTGRMIGADEALGMGLLNEVAAAGELDTAVARWVEEILKCSPAAVAATKQAALRGLDEPSLATAIAHHKDYPAFAALKASPDNIEGPRSFAEKRAPKWADA